MNALDRCFNTFGSGLLYLRRGELIEYFRSCYPMLSNEQNYEDRCSYWLSRYGLKLSEVRAEIQEALDSMGDSKEAVAEIVDSYATNRRKKEEDKKEAAHSDAVPKVSKSHSITIRADRPTLNASMSGEGDSEEIVLFKTKWLLIYRKAAVDKVC